MITTNRSPQESGRLAVSPSQLKGQTAPGVNSNSLPPTRPAQVKLEDKVESAAHQDEGLSLWKKAVLGTMAGVAGFAGIAQTANAAPTQSIVTQDTSAQDGLEVMVLPHNTPRVDLIRKTYERHDDRGQDRKESYSDVGVHLGGGIFHDTNGNLSLVPSLAAGWNDGITDFSQVEATVPLGYDDTISRFGNTVHFKDSPYSRYVFVELSNRTEIHHRGDVETYELIGDGVQFRSEPGLLWRVTQGANGTILVDGPGDQDVTLNYGRNGIDVRGQGISNQVHHDANRLAIRGSGTDYTATRYGNGALTEIDGGFLNQSSIIRNGDHIRIEGTFSDRTIAVDPASVNQNRLTFQQLTDRIEEAEPGYAAKHPLVMAVLEYAVANPGLVGEGQDTESFIRTGSRIAAGGGALASGSALMTGAQALSLAENAQALGAAALASKAAAQAAAQAGNLSQAASFAAEAQGFADQARSVGSEAMRLGEKAQNTAQVARVMTGVAGALQVIDGGMDLHRGASNKSVVEGAQVITESMREMLSETLTGAELEQTMEDYSKVMSILRDLEKNANKQMTVGGLKIGCGGLMLISALAGGAVIPPIIGAVGLACTVGTMAYEHWDELEAFFSGEPLPEDRTLREVLPQPLHDEIIIRMDSPDTN